MLDCSIRLTPIPVQSFTVGTEGTNSGGDLGVAASIGYQNVNLFHGAEIFNLKLKGAVEVQQLIGSGSKNIIEAYLPFNTIETGIGSSIELPKFLLPVPQENFSLNNNPKTDINLGVDYQENSDYARNVADFSFGYKWKETKQKTWILDPIALSGVSIKMDTAFRNKINTLNDIILTNSYSNHLTAGLKLSFIYNTQNLNKNVSFDFLRVNFQTSGNTIYLVDKYIIKPDIQQQGYYNFINNRFAQYVKLDGDYRYYNIINNYNEIVYRGFLGVGNPYGNLNVLPFEESYYCGGANDIRAWEIHCSPGPGSYIDPTKTMFDKIGDIKL